VKISGRTKGILWNNLGSVMYGANTVIMQVVVSYAGTVEQTGYFSIAFTTAQILYVIGLLGVSHYQMTDYAEKYRFTEYAFVRACSSGVMLLCSVVMTLFLGYQGEKLIYVSLLTVWMLLNVTRELFQSRFFQKNRLDLSGSSQFYFTFWPLLAFCCAVLLTRNIVLALGIHVALAAVITWHYAARVAPPFLPEQAEKPSGGEAWRLVRDCAPLFVSTLLLSGILNISRYVVEYILGDTAQGYYGMIFILVQVVDLCSRFLFLPFLNQYAQAYFDSKYRKFAQMAIRQIAIIAGLTILCCVGAYWLGTPVLGILYRRNFSALRSLIILTVLGSGIYSITTFFYWIFTTLRKQLGLMIILSVALFTEAAALVILLPRLGLNGAVGAFIAANGVAVLCFMGYMISSIRRQTNA